ncbi:hypothetical protein HJA82_26550 [Rhizobium bangladeshense]|nr:hypothetical protein [Rhizobium bangladeshense]MBX5253773.1 hypothetical protein [Rhizobium sp. NLR4b]MBX5260017.1 hypothetical protein [Rhizobium sp. NLR16b]MBX5266109.1 hypothetical protein [Rhizobium sp. NLR16a]MBX5314675.1 hypothetical protein [Rhizobium sp. NLR11b]
MLVQELGLRERTGRRRFRMWAFCNGKTQRSCCSLRSVGSARGGEYMS